LAAALTSLVEDPARRAAMGAAARSLAVRQHDRRLLAARFLALVESVTARRAISVNPTGFVVSGRR
jgi:glycosyltransferase involved in cell wall biosynthesis